VFGTRSFLRPTLTQTWLKIPTDHALGLSTFRWVYMGARDTELNYHGPQSMDSTDDNRGPEAALYVSCFDVNVLPAGQCSRGGGGAAAGGGAGL
jgi:hypothetical protein